jgi:hypothetical protein
MDGRISVAPSALRSAWQDSGLFAARRLQPQVLASAAPASTAGPEGMSPAQPSGFYTPQTEPSAPTYNSSGRMASSAGLYAAAHWERSDSIELQVTTAEGDVATLRLSQSSSASAAAGAWRSGDAAGSALAWDALTGESMDISVAGDLNEDEQSAIDALAAQLATVAEKFFGGDLEAALSSAGQISISDQSETLSAFAYSMRSQEVLAATALYEQVAQAGDDAPAPAAPSPIEPVPVASSEGLNPAGASGMDGNGGAQGLSPRDLIKQILAMLQNLTGDDAGRPGSAFADTAQRCLKLVQHETAARSLNVLGPVHWGGAQTRLKLTSG